jgi:fatty acid kinase fatty acid binding subunit
LRALVEVRNTMPGIQIVTDSTGYIPTDLVRKYGIHVAPQILIWGEETLRDGIDILPDAFYERLKKASVMPTTSQATVAEFQEVYQKAAAQGTPVLAILLSSKLSGTISSAVQAKELVPQVQVEIIDSYATSMAMGYQVLAAARAAESGKEFADVVAVARDAVNKTGVVFVVDTLEFLHRGGRIGGASKLLGTALNLKPVLELVDGRIEPVEKIRTKTKAVARMLDMVEARVKGRPNLRLAAIHAAARDEAQALLDEASARLKPVEAHLVEASPVVGTHAGPGTVGLAYCTDL